MSSEVKVGITGMGYLSSSPGSVEEHLELLLTLLPKWVTKVVVKKRTYLKINKDTSLKLLTSQLQRKEEELKN